MTNDLKKYQWATVILAILVIVLAIALYQSNQAKVNVDLEQIKLGLEECSSNLRSWGREYEDQQTSDKARVALIQTLTGCSESLQ